MREASHIFFNRKILANFRYLHVKFYNYKIIKKCLFFLLLLFYLCLIVIFVLIQYYFLFQFLFYLLILFFVCLVGEIFCYLINFEFKNNLKEK